MNVTHLVSLLALAASFDTRPASPEATARPLAKQFARTPAPRDPADNPSTPAKVALGQRLFFDPRLSASGIVSCATCHNPSFSWGDGLPRAVGHGMKVLGRRTPTILNAAWGGPFMWDGRFESLEQQALGPITSTAEMNMAGPDLLAHLSAVPEYRERFDAVFPGQGLTLETLARAIAAYERTVVSAPAPFDRWVAGDQHAIDDAAKRGFVLFTGKARCSGCHSGWRFTDDGFHDIGVSDADLGRGGLKDFADIEALQHGFKTPTLRDCARRGPWLHDGSATSLEAVIDLYDAGGLTRRGSLSDDVRPLKLSAGEKADLLAFLKTLSSPVDAVVPALPR